jgi:hypothetical protein
MKILRRLSLLSATLLVSTALYALTASGKWTATVDLGGQGGSPTFVLEQTGDKLTGTYTGALGDATLHGTVKDTDVTFDFDAAGGTVHYTGKLSADGTKITGTCDYGSLGKGTFTATRTDPAKTN